ncbi:hypothetical protein [Mesorhizobium sp. LNJC405B00]|uniref:hypothetical protein n=1 Tax=Mesorhizobium sp. LNJC405B00 TaxID=1287281 RepID=UPI000AFE7D9E|nr:hypothetical protein [Mesorhizobium sp. LNJC405B00]
MDSSIDSFAEYARNVGTTLLVGTAIVGSLQLIKSDSFYDDLIREIGEISNYSALVQRSPDTVLSSFATQMDPSKYALRTDGYALVDNPEFAQLEIPIDSDHEKEWSQASDVQAMWKSLIVGGVGVKQIIGTVPISTENVTRPVTIRLPKQELDGQATSHYADGELFYTIEENSNVKGKQVTARYPSFRAPRTLEEFKEFWSLMRAGFEVRSIAGPQDFGSASINMRVIRSDFYYHRDDEVANGGIHYTQLGKGFFRLVTKPDDPTTKVGNGVILLAGSGKFSYGDPAIYQFTLYYDGKEYVPIYKNEITVAATPMSVDEHLVYPEPTAGNYGYLPIYELDLSLPVKERLERLSVSDIGGEPVDFLVDFDQRFPTVASAGKSFLKVNYSTVREMASTLRGLDTGSSEILGIKIPNSFLRGWGATIVVGLQVYFFLYLRQFRQRISDAPAPPNVPWSLLDNGALARAFSIVGYVLFPIAVCVTGYITMRPDQSMWIVPAVGVASLVFGGWSTRESMLIWKITADYARAKSATLPDVPTS